MEVLFENQNAMTKAQLIEFYKNQHKAITVKYAIFSSVLLLGHFLFCWFFGFFDLFSVFVAVVVIALIVMVAKRPVKSANTSYKKLLAYYDNVMPVYRIYFGDKIIIETPDCTSTIEYRKIEKILSLKYGYVICDKKPSFFILSRGGFTKGTFEEFKQFLREKCPELTVPE